jgi:hypothetical protein
VEDAIVEFMVEYIVKNNIEATIDIIATQKPPLIDKPPAQFIIVYSPISAPIDGDYSKLVNALETKHAKRVWIYEKGNLTTPVDMQKAIEDYYHNHIQNAPQNPPIFTWSYDEFGIFSISEDVQSAEVYLVDTCGTLCGSGIVLKLAVGDDGTWYLKDIVALWGS